MTIAPPNHRTAAMPDESVRWSVVVSWAAALAIHVALFAWLLVQQVHEAEMTAGTMSAVFVELAPIVEPAVPDIRADEPPIDVETDPAPVEPALPPIEAVEIPTTSEPAEIIAAPAQAESEFLVDSRPTAPATQASRPAVQSAGSPSSSAAANEALARWQAALLAHLQQHHRYPYRARRLREEGVVQIRFAVNRAGELQRFDLAESSGHALLDEESLAMIQRAEPLPAPPPDVPGDTIEVIVPVTFELRHR